MAAAFLFFGSDREYGSLSDALTATIAQALPPYHPTADTAQQQQDSGAPVGATAPAVPQPPAATETTPRVQ